jgi:hypothetical protein
MTKYARRADCYLSNCTPNGIVIVNNPSKPPTGRMSTQDPDAGVPISIRHESGLEHYRLLELPPDLLALLTSDNPPV